MMRDVLIFTPVLRLEPETVCALMSLQWQGPLSLLFQRDNPSGHPKLDHLHQYRRGRETFLAGGWDGMLVVESDIVPPADTLRRLAALDADVAYGCYLFRSRSPVVNVSKRYPGPSVNVGPSLMAEPGLWMSACRQGIVECSGSGMGCVLIKRHVLESIGFRLAHENGQDPVHCDFYWTQDVHRAGYSMKADTGVLCEHIDADGSVMKFVVVDDGPDYERPWARAHVQRRQTMKVIAVKSFFAVVEGARRRVDQGDEFELPDNVDWLQAGFVKPLTGPTERAVRPAGQKAVSQAGLFDLVGQAAAALAEAGYETVEAARQAIDAGEDLTQIAGVGPATVKKLKGKGRK